jgi:pimeloyl-ACP methyl ester carboxylesterase
MRTSTFLLFAVLSFFGLRLGAEVAPRHILIFVPGYYGSFLKNQVTGDREFLSLKQVVFHVDPLVYPIEGVFPEAKVVVPDNYFNAFSVVPGLFTIDGYGDTVDTFKSWGKTKGYEVTPIAYDWRADLGTILQTIDTEVQKLELKPQDQVIWAGHSFGALLTAYYMRYGVQDPTHATENFKVFDLIDAWILAGAPFRGTAQIFRNSIYGVPAFGFRDVLAPSAISSYPSTFLLTPPAEFLRVFDEHGNLQSLDAHNPENYEKYKWGLFQDKLGLPASSLEKRREWTRKQAGIARAFWSKLLAPMQTKTNAKILILTGESHLTNQIGAKIPGQDQYVFLPEQYRKYDVKKDPALSDVDGDRVVPFTSAEPLPFLKLLGAEWIRTQTDHAALLKSKDTQVHWKKFLESQGL